MRERENSQFVSFGITRALVYDIRYLTRSFFFLLPLTVLEQNVKFSRGTLWLISSFYRITFRISSRSADIIPYNNYCKYHCTIMSDEHIIHPYVYSWGGGVLNKRYGIEEREKLLLKSICDIIYAFLMCSCVFRFVRKCIAFFIIFTGAKLYNNRTISFIFQPNPILIFILFRRIISGTTELAKHTVYTYILSYRLNV